mmetsp:Transcript_13191/g.30325  ORF Transcript_13191/g.30325 Transcript_13191/m.30325 type:complete len:99 (+) Transcript_13191:593-889(+)
MRSFPPPVFFIDRDELRARLQPSSYLPWLLEESLHTFGLYRKECIILGLCPPLMNANVCIPLTPSGHTAASHTSMRNFHNPQPRGSFWVIFRCLDQKT